MKRVVINKKNLLIFLSNIRQNDKEELIYFLKDNYKDKFINIVLENVDNTIMLSYKGIPACIGGIYPDNIGVQIWLLCSNQFDKKYLYKYIKYRLQTYKERYSFIYNIIYKTNFSSIKMLKNFDFKIKDLPDTNIKLFYYKKGA